METKNILEEQLIKNKEEKEKHQNRLLVSRLFLSKHGTITERRACKFQLDKMTGNK